MITVELAVEDQSAAVTALRAGADRLEVCSVLCSGGITPTLPTVESVLQVADAVPVHAMVRCRPGSFVFDDFEIDLMVREVRSLRRAGVAGLVIGALTASGTLDRRALMRLIEAADGAALTLHRAFDSVNDSTAALAEAIDLRFSRILTSGSGKSASCGADAILDIVRLAGQHTNIVAAGGIRSENVLGLINRTGVSEIHTAAANRPPERNYRTFGYRVQPSLDEARKIVQLAHSIGTWPS